DTPARAADRGEPLTSRGGRWTHGACPTTAHSRTAHPWLTRSTPWPPHHATDRRNAPHRVEPAEVHHPGPCDRCDVVTHAARRQGMAGLTPDRAGMAPPARSGHRRCPRISRVDRGGAAHAPAACPPLSRGMTKRGVLDRRWQRTRRVPGKVLAHHLLFLHNPRPEHQEV